MQSNSCTQVEVRTLCEALERRAHWFRGLISRGTSARVPSRRLVKICAESLVLAAHLDIIVLAFVHLYNQ